MCIRNWCFDCRHGVQRDDEMGEPSEGQPPERGYYLCTNSTCEYFRMTFDDYELIEADDDCPGWKSIEEMMPGDDDLALEISAINW